MMVDDDKLATIRDMKRIVAPLGLQLGEVLHHNKLIIEAASDMQRQMKGFARQEVLEAVKRDVKAMKLALSATDRQVQDNEQRITRLGQG